MTARPLRIVVVGSLPPPVGGTTVLLHQLLKELSELPDVEVRAIDTGPGGPFRTAARLMAATAVHAPWCDLVTLHASPPGLAAVLPVLLPYLRWLRRPLLARVFGGSLDQELAQAAPDERDRLERVFACQQVLVETRQCLASLHRDHPQVSLDLFPNSRPLPGNRPEPPRGGARRFAFVGHVTAAKGVVELADAADWLADDRLIFDLYGPPPTELAVAKRLAGTERVRYLGPLAPERVVPTLASYDALVLPTHHPGEGHPGVVLEAHAAGRPVVATRWRAVPEVVENEVSGLLVPPRDPGALAKGLRRLVDSEALVRRLSDGAWHSAQHHSSRRSTERFVAICRRVAAPSGGA